jgi:hypothetical protein
MSNPKRRQDAAENAANEKQATLENILKVATKAYESKMAALVLAQAELSKAKDGKLSSKDDFSLMARRLLNQFLMTSGSSFLISTVLFEV